VLQAQLELLVLEQLVLLDLQVLQDLQDQLDLLHQQLLILLEVMLLLELILVVMELIRQVVHIQQEAVMDKCEHTTLDFCTTNYLALGDG
jgi:hypothetical protein